MACELTLADVTFDCTDLGIGGLKSVYIANRNKLISNTETTGNAVYAPIAVTGDTVTVTKDSSIVSGDADNVVAVLAAGDDASRINFNLKDGFSVFTDVKSVSADGIVSTVPTIAVEVPSMSEAHRNALNDIAKAGAELVAFVETAAGTYHMVGFDYGMYAATVDGTSGTGRSEKNRFQITLTGDEDSLAYSLTAAQWADITSSVAP